MKGRMFTLIGLFLFCLVVFLPPIMYGYVYPNVGDDTAVYLEVFETWQATGQRPVVQYLAYILVGYFTISVSNLLNLSLNVVFLWFNFAALAMVGLAIYFVMSRLTDRKTAWCALLITLFCTQGILFLFYYGQVFNIINIGIILPLLVYFAVKYFTERKNYQLVLSLCFAGLFGGFHTTGIYLPVIAGFLLLSYFVYCRCKKLTLDKPMVFLGVGVVGFSVAVFVGFILMPTMTVLERYQDWEHINFIRNIGKGLAVPMTPYLLNIVSPTLFALAILVGVYYEDIFKDTGRRVRILICLLSSTALVLAIASFTKLSLDPWRQALDFATVLALLVAVFIGLLLGKHKNKFVIAVLVVSIGFGLYHNLATWFSYDSAIRPVDLEAIAYADNFETFSCSGTVAPWIYERFTKAEWMGNDGDLVIVRSTPMTPRSTEGNIWFQKHGWEPDNSYGLTKKFNDGEVTIEIWEVKAEYRDD